MAPAPIGALRRAGGAWLLLGAGLSVASAMAPSNVSRNPGDSLVPSVAVDPDGGGHVVWHDNSSGRFEIRYSRSADGGASFTPAVPLSGAGEAQVPAIATGARGIVLVAWEAEVGTNRHVLFSRSGDGGKSFEPAVHLTPGVGDSRFPAVATHGAGRVYVAWQDASGTGRRIRLRHSTDGGKTFEPVRPPVPHAVGARGPSIAVDSAGAVNLVWQGSMKEGGGVIFARSADGGVTFSAPRRLAPGAGERRAPVLATAGGEIYLAWRDRVAGRWEILFSRSADGGQTFSPPLNVSRTTGLANAPAIAASGRGQITVAWQDDRTGTPQIFVARSSDGGLTFSSPVNVSATSGFAHIPALAAGPGRVFLAWQDNSTGNFEILFRALAEGGEPRG